jgi:hypothetical protein
VAQRIEPDFFSGIGPGAGKDNGRGDVEREAFDVASYGRQLGLISEVLLGMASQDGLTRAKGEESLARLKGIHDQVEDIKRRHQASDLEAARLALDQLRQSDPAALAVLVQRFASATPQLGGPATR